MAYTFDHDDPQDCVECVDGKYQPSPGQASCLRCPAGSRQIHHDLAAKITQDYCLPCPPGMYNDEPGRTACKFCPAGKITVPSYTLQIALDPSDQHATRYADVDSVDDCAPCVAGKYRAHGASVECSFCPKGHYSQGTGNLQCQTCPEGKYSLDVGAADDSGCVDCPSGKKSNTDRDGCGTCDSGTYNLFGSCIQCSPGNYQDKEEQIQCKPCEPGSFQKDSGALECETCEQGHYQDNFGQHECLACPRGTTNNEENTQCERCEPGKYSDSPGKPCADCEQGKYTGESGSVECDWCEVGKYSQGSGATSCFECEAGKVPNEDRDRCQPSNVEESECDSSGYKLEYWTQCAPVRQELVNTTGTCYPFYDENLAWNLSTDKCMQMPTTNTSNVFFTDPKYLALKWSDYPQRGIVQDLVPEKRKGLAAANLLNTKFKLTAWNDDSVQIFNISTTNRILELDDGSRPMPYRLVNSTVLRLGNGRVIQDAFYSPADSYLVVLLAGGGMRVLAFASPNALVWLDDEGSQAVFLPNDELLFWSKDSEDIIFVRNMTSGESKNVTVDHNVITLLGHSEETTLDFFLIATLDNGGTTVLEWNSQEGNLAVQTPDGGVTPEKTYLFKRAFDPSTTYEIDSNDVQAEEIKTKIYSWPMPVNVTVTERKHPAEAVDEQTVADDPMENHEEFLKLLSKQEKKSTDMLRSRDAGLTFVIMRSRTMLFAVRNGPDAGVEWELPLYFDDEAKILALHEPADGSLLVHTTNSMLVLDKMQGSVLSVFGIPSAQFYTTQLLNGYLLLEWACGDGSWVGTDSISGHRVCQDQCSEDSSCYAACDRGFLLRGVRCFLSLARTRAIPPRMKLDSLAKNFAQEISACALAVTALSRKTSATRALVTAGEISTGTALSRCGLGKTLRDCP